MHARRPGAATTISSTIGTTIGTILLGVLAVPAAAAPSPVAAAADTCVYGAIGARYAALGGPQGLLGAVRTCEAATPVTAGRYNHFERGSIYWSRATGAWDVHGAILDRWRQLGWENSALGFPASGENRITGGVFQRFQGASVYWSPATGPRTVTGAISQAWGATGYERGRLGYPTTDETATPDGRGRYNHFQRGSVYWSPATGAHVVEGAIREAWAAQGWEKGRLGYPVSGEYPLNGGGRAALFEGGFVEWSAAGGADVHLTSARAVGVSGCPVPAQGVSTAEQAADCVVRGWDAPNFAVVGTYASNGVAGRLAEFGTGGDIGPYEVGECSPVPRSATTSAGLECDYYFPPVPGDGMVHGVAMVFGMGQTAAGYRVESVDFFG